jgi:hypothetical protein
MCHRYKCKFVFLITTKLQMYGNQMATYYPADFLVTEPENLASLITQTAFLEDHELFQSFPCLHNLLVFKVRTICFLVLQVPVIKDACLEKFYTPHYNTNCISENKYKL